MNRPLAPLLLLVLGLVALAAPAAAGGPTSVLLSAPGTGRTASLYHSDPAYDLLAEQVGVTGGLHGAQETGRRHGGRAEVTLTWLIHDVTPWRVDRVFVGDDGETWIATQQSLGDDRSLWESPTTWHRPASEARLNRLLDELGLLGAAPQQAEPLEGPAVEEPAVEEPGKAPVEATPTAAGAWWAVPGAAAGVLLAWGALRVRRRLDDAGPEGTGVLPDGVDRLAWPARSARR